MRYIITFLIAVVFVGCQNPQYYPYQPPRYQYDYERPYNYYDDGHYEWYNERYGDSYRDAEKEMLISEHNTIRYGKRLGMLKSSRDLNRSAQEQAEWMAMIKTLTHRDAAGLTVGQRVHGNWRYVGENIAFGYRDTKETMNAWMRSPDHHRNIVGPHYTHIGVGVAEDIDGVRYWCIIFGG